MPDSKTDSTQSNLLDLPDEPKYRTGMDADDKKTLRGSEIKLVNKKPFTKAVAKAYDDTGLGIKFGQFHDRWQYRLLSFARKVREIEVDD